MELDFKPITLQDKEKLYGYISREHKNLGWEYSFPTIYLWNVFNETKVAYDDIAAYVTTKYFGKCIFYPPFTRNESDFNTAIFRIIEHINKVKCTAEIRGLTKQQAEYFEENLIKTQPNFSTDSENNKYGIYTNRDNSDYIYNADDLINLRGKKFHSKRNFISRFENKYSYTFREYTDSDFGKVIELCEKWHQRSDNETVDVELIVIKNALKLRNELELKVGLLEVDGNLVAFSISYRENSFIARGMIEKADTSYDGAYQVINKKTAETFFDGVQYVSREEDMGLEGLRKAKLSYNPVIILDKYMITVKN